MNLYSLLATLGIPSSALPTLAACTLITGNAKAPGLGVSPGDLTTMQAKYASDPRHFPLFTPIPFTSNRSVGPDGEVAVGRPVTGPPTAGEADVVSIDSAVGQIFGDLPPAGGTPPTVSKQVIDSSCGPESNGDYPVADLLNRDLGLPYAAGQVLVTQPTTFAIQTS